jgi:hypothetical protein
MATPSEPSGPRRRIRRQTSDETEIEADAFAQEFGEDLSSILDVSTWQTGRDLDAEYASVEHQVRLAVACETEDQAHVRESMFPLIAQLEHAPPGAGHHAVRLDEIEAVHRAVLFNGLVEACDGNSNPHSTLALTIYQIGVCLASYGGECGSWQHRLFRRDVRQRGSDPMQDVLDLLSRRGRRGSLEERDRDPTSQLAQRGLMSYAERAVLARRAQSPWRMGHGSPAPLELLTNYFTDLVIESIRVVRELIDHERFVFVASDPADRGLMTLGQGLHPLEYLIVGTLRDRIAPHLDDWRQTHPATVDTSWDGEELTPRQWVEKFRDEVAPHVVYGLYRATLLAPPQLFYAHEKHAHVAARIALADSVLHEQRGFPQLIDLADHYCRSIYGGQTLREMTQSAYADAGAPFRYQSERPTRDSL